MGDVADPGRRAAAIFGPLAGKEAPREPRDRRRRIDRDESKALSQQRAPDRAREADERRKAGTMDELGAGDRAARRNLKMKPGLVTISRHRCR